MNITRKLIEWVDNKMDEAYDEDNTRKAYAKAIV